MISNKHLVGVGGWLSIFIVLLFIGGGISLLSAVGAGDWKGLEIQNPALLTNVAFLNLQITDRVVELITGLLLLYCGCILYCKKGEKTLKKAKAIVLIYPLTVIFRDIIAPYLFMGLSSSNQAVIDEVVKAILWAAIWSAYLNRSKRVNNTYNNLI